MYELNIPEKEHREFEVFGNKCYKRQPFNTLIAELSTKMLN